MPTPRDDVVWFNNWIPDLSCLKISDLTQMEVETRKKMLLTYQFFKKNVPGFETAIFWTRHLKWGRGGADGLSANMY